MGHPLIILLPGLDGTGELFTPLLSIMPAGLPRHVVAYPSDQLRSYDELWGFLQREIPRDCRVVLVAESFSGPLAIRYAAAHPCHVHAVVLCASFMTSPVPRWLRFVVRPLLFRMPMPAWVIRTLLVGWRAPAPLVCAVRQAIRKVPPAVLAHRVRQVMDVDCSKALAACITPILYLRAGDDRLVGERCVSRITACKGDVQVSIVPGPHLLLQAEPAAAWREIERFLSGTSRLPVDSPGPDGVATTCS